MTDNNIIYDPEGQAARRQEICETFTAERIDWFDDEGDWVGPENKEPYFWTAWMYISPFMKSGDATAVRRAVAMMEKARGWYLDLVHELLVHREWLTDKAVAAIEQKVEEHVRTEVPYCIFTGDNDNIPLATAAMAALWGAHSGDREATELARERLDEFRLLLTRRGLQSEYTAPGYTSMQLHPTALIAEFGADEDLRTLARDIETRLWIDILGHWHFPSWSLCGAYTRAVNFHLFWGSFAHMHAAIALGEDAVGDWRGCWQARDGWRAKGSELFLRRAVNKTCAPYHCPTWLAEWALNRQYPYQITASADGCPSYCNAEPGTDIFTFCRKGRVGEDDDLYAYPCWSTRAVTYMTEHYGLGTSRRAFSDASQYNGFIVTIPAKRPLDTLRDTVRIFSRYVVNETEPFVTNTTNHNPHVKREMGAEQTTFEEMGRIFALQHERTAMVLYHPRLHVARQATSLKAAVFIPNADFGSGDCRGDEILIGKQPVEDFRGESEEPVPVFVRLDETYMALIPLLAVYRRLTLTRRVAVRVRPEGKALAISFYNYEGDPMDLDRRQCAVIGNGFVCEMGSLTEDGSFQAFRQRFQDVEIDDRHGGGLNTRGTIRRQTCYRRPGLELAMEYNPTTEGIRYQTINGKLAPEPQLEATGLPLERVPFL